MANSKYEYVKSFEVEDEIMPPNIIVVRVDGRDFRSFSEAHGFQKPYDIKALELMNDCAKAVSEQFPDIVFSYGFSDEYSFVFKKGTKFYQRRASKIQSLIVSFFTSIYVAKWKEFFPHKDLRYALSLRSRVISCASVELIKSGKTGKEAGEMLKGSQKQEKNEMLYKYFNINYTKDIQEIFRHGTCVLKKELDVEDIVKFKDDGRPCKRPRRKVITVHYEKNIASQGFWEKYLLKEVGQFSKDLNRTQPDYVRSFQYESRLMPFTWIVIRIDGCHFHRFSDVHEFEKPNDAQALNLMNSCAVGVLEEFKDIVFAYGVSDEYSFVLKKESQLFGRRASEIVSAVVSFFSSIYTMKWNDFFPHKEMKYSPYFDGRAVCYPSSEILRDYLTWRQVDCHINNQYNTCFWMLVKSGKSKSEAQNCLKGTQTREKNQCLDELSGIINYYNTLTPMVRQGSSVYWDQEMEEKGGAAGKIVVVKHCNIIEASFWEAHPDILDEKRNGL